MKAPTDRWRARTRKEKNTGNSERTSGHVNRHVLEIEKEKKTNRTDRQQHVTDVAKKPTPPHQPTTAQAYIITAGCYATNSQRPRHQ